MITTNKTKPKEQEELKKAKVITANELEPKGFDFTTREYPDVDKRETSKVEGPMLTTENMEERQIEVFQSRASFDKPTKTVKKKSKKRKKK